MYQQQQVFLPLLLQNLTWSAATQPAHSNTVTAAAGAVQPQPVVAVLVVAWCGPH
jgi:hypothetical protein